MTERFSGFMRARVRLLAWLLLIFSVVSIATSAHLLRYELKGPLTDVPLAAAGPCQADEEWGKWRLSQNAIWRTGNDRFALRSLDAEICHDFALPRGGAAFLVVDTGGQAYTLALEAVSEGTRITPVEAPQQERRLYRIEGAQSAHIRLSATNPDADSLTLRQVYATQDPGERLSSWNRDVYAALIEMAFNVYILKYAVGFLLLITTIICGYFVLIYRFKHHFRCIFFSSFFIQQHGGTSFFCIPITYRLSQLII